MIYFVQTADNRHTKIGYAANVKKRMAGLQTGSPTPLKLMASMPGDRTVEQAIHARFANLRVNGEWFHTSRAIAEFAMRGGHLAGLRDSDHFIYYAVLEPYLVDVFVSAASVVDAGDHPYFCANAVFYREFKARICSLVGWDLPPSAHRELRSTAAYDVCYERVYEALPNCRGCQCL